MLDGSDVEAQDQEKQEVGLTADATRPKLRAALGPSQKLCSDSILCILVSLCRRPLDVCRNTGLSFSAEDTYCTLVQE